MLIKNKRIFTIAMIFAILVGTGYFLFYYSMQHKKQEQTKQTLIIKVHQIDSWLSAKKHLIKNLASSLELVDYNKETHLPFMRKTNKIMETHSVFSGFKDGQYIDTQGYWKNNFDPRIRPWYMETINTKETTISGPMYYNDISGQKITWWSIASAFYKDGKPFGVISGEILPEMLSKQLKEVSTKSLKTVFLFQKETGMIIAAIEANKENRFIKDIFSKELVEQLQQTKNSSVDFEYKGIPSMVYAFDLKEAPWVLCAIDEK